jgi:ubiquitin thioesterase OTU1
VETGRVDTFDPQSPSGQRCILLYSGIHYDTVSLTPDLNAPDEWHQTLFPASTDPDPVLDAASQLATKLRQKKAFTNTNTFDLKCQDCGIGLKGEKDARAHAQKTGHIRFGEY